MVFSISKVASKFAPQARGIYQVRAASTFCQVAGIKEPTFSFIGGEPPKKGAKRFDFNADTKKEVDPVASDYIIFLQQQRALYTAMRHELGPLPLDLKEESLKAYYDKLMAAAHKCGFTAKKGVLMEGAIDQAAVQSTGVADLISRLGKTGYVSNETFKKDAALFEEIGEGKWDDLTEEDEEYIAMAEEDAWNDLVAAGLDTAMDLKRGECSTLFNPNAENPFEKLQFVEFADQFKEMKEECEVHFRALQAKDPKYANATFDFTKIDPMEMLVRTDVKMRDWCKGAITAN